MRLAKHLAHAGVASRRPAEQLVFDGPGHWSAARSSATRRATSTARARSPSTARPVGAPSTSARRLRPQQARRRRLDRPRDPQGPPTVVDLVQAGRRLYPVGRLDADTTGLILLTNDGELAHRLTHPSLRGARKTYRAPSRAPAGARAGAARAARGGSSSTTAAPPPAQVRRLASGELELTIHEGRKRQVRRMCEAVGPRGRSPRARRVRPAAAGRPAAPGGHRRRADRAPRSSGLPAPPG